MALLGPAPPEPATTGSVTVATASAAAVRPSTRRITTWTSYIPAWA
jgi:hypothetical protein